MSHPTDDQRILDEIERDLTRDDPALVTLIDMLNEQFVLPLDQPKGNRGALHTPRAVVAIVLVMIALLGLLLTAVLNAGGAPSGADDGGPAAMPAVTTAFR